MNNKLWHIKSRQLVGKNLFVRDYCRPVLSLYGLVVPGSNHGRNRSPVRAFFQNGRESRARPVSSTERPQSVTLAWRPGRTRHFWPMRRTRWSIPRGPLYRWPPWPSIVTIPLSAAWPAILTSFQLRIGRRRHGRRLYPPLSSLPVP